MKTASKVTRFVGLGFSIATLAGWGYYVIKILLSVAKLLIIPFLGVFALIFAGFGLVVSLALATYPLIVSIMAVSRLSKNKPSIGIGVMMITSSLFAESLLFFPITAGVLIILSAVFRKRAEEKKEQN